MESREQPRRENPIVVPVVRGFLLRWAQRTFLSLLLNAPPRNTRLLSGPSLHKDTVGRGDLAPTPLRGNRLPCNLLPAAQQLADLGPLPGAVLVLPRRKALPAKGQAQVKAHLVQLGVGQIEFAQVSQS